MNEVPPKQVYEWVKSGVWNWSKFRAWYDRLDVAGNKVDGMFFCPVCKGPHFNITVGGKLVCASVSQFTDYEVRVGGCGWVSEDGGIGNGER